MDKVIKEDPSCVVTTDYFQKTGFLYSAVFEKKPINPEINYHLVAKDDRDMKRIIESRKEYLGVIAKFENGEAVALWR